MEASTLTAILLAVPALALGGLAGAWFASRSAKRRLDEARAFVITSTCTPISGVISATPSTLKRVWKAESFDGASVIPDAAHLALAFRTVHALRRAGVRVQMHAAAQAGPGSMKSQFKRADSSGARFALVFGQQEVAQGEVIVKSLRDGTGNQQLRSLANVADWAATLQSPT